jgi:predicted ester cyclase
MSKAATQRGTEETVRAYFDALERRDLDAIAAAWHPEGVDRLYGLAEMVGPEGLRAYFAGIFASFPDFAIEVIDLLAIEDRSTVRWRATGTFSGDAKYEGLAPSGASIELEGLDLITVRNGLLIENQAYTNATVLARQLGAMPPAGSIAERAMLAAVNAGQALKALPERLRR